MTARILCIGGSDSGGGAGIQADLKTITMLGGYGMTAITALTAQNTIGVSHILLAAPESVTAQIDAVISDIGVDAIKIGMLGSAEIAHRVADCLAAASVPIVFDPVMVATSGATLADEETIAAFRRLMALATLVTPNLPELAVLGGRDRVLAHGCQVLIKGGHAEGDQIADELWSSDGFVRRVVGKRLNSSHTHGTGCTLASAIACRLGQGMAMASAFGDGVRFVRQAILAAPRLGHGHGPLGHSDVRDFWDEGGAGPHAAINHVMIGARDYRKSIDFYLTLGLTQIVDAAESGCARFESANGVTLSVDVTNAVVASAVVFLESSRLDDWLETLVARGLAFDQLPKDEAWGWREARLRDPAGNIICLYAAAEMRRFPLWRI
jgi:hydroxymethylpyrimidine/phosphomethylpyrimidine kinase